uniref:Uncharacterized protein n=1 Tax=Oryza nivara TaxID=4536 RepID=A0A0E0HCJ9_ORYNI
MSSPDPATSSLDLAAADLASSDTTTTVAVCTARVHETTVPTTMGARLQRGGLDHMIGWNVVHGLISPHTYKFHTQAKAPFSAKQAETYRQKHLSPHRSTRPERRQLKP